MQESPREKAGAGGGGASIAVRSDAGLLGSILIVVQSASKCLSASYVSGAVLRTGTVLNSRLDPCFQGARLERVYVLIGAAGKPP